MKDVQTVCSLCEKAKKGNLWVKVSSEEMQLIEQAVRYDICKPCINSTDVVAITKAINRIKEEILT